MSTTPKIGDWVQIRTKEEILATLDEKGCLDEMPFMPEMLNFCGQKFRVYKSAHKTCDYSGPKVRSRRLENTVHLETRCDGSSHDGCQAGCLLYWKKAWLKSADEVETQNVVQLPTPHTVESRGLPNVGCTEGDLWRHTKVADSDSMSPTYICQTTQIPVATKNLEWWDLRQYLQDYWSGNVPLSRLITSAIYSTYFNLSNAGIGIGKPMRWFYNQVRFLWRGSIWPRTQGRIPAGQPTPTVFLDLQPGDLVRVKSHNEILQTVTTDDMNRGMRWDAELVPYCGGTYRVLKRVTHIIHERTGKMTRMKTPCIILDSVVCQARYAFCRMMCPKAMYPYWREVWLERVGVSRENAMSCSQPIPSASVGESSVNKETAEGVRG